MMNDVTMSYDAILQSLMTETAASHSADTKAKLDLFIRRLEMKEKPGDLLYYLFATALMKRVEPSEIKPMNLYLRDYGVPQIKLFNLLAARFPLIFHASELSNSLLSGYIQHGEAVTLLEVGIGTGRQLVSLIKLLARQGKRPASITLYAIEPNVSCLEDARKNVEETAYQAGIPLLFKPVPVEIERLTPSDWKQFSAHDGRLLVNATFAMHHIGDFGTSGIHSVKTAVLQSIRELQPSCIVLCEPDSDHQTPDTLQRFTNCWEHFSTLFRLIDSLDLSDEENRILKIFFGREIEDIIASPEQARFERHETTNRWIGRLQHAGFTSCPYMRLYASRTFEKMNATSSPWHIGLGMGSTNLVSVIAAVPDNQPG
ncbi:GRAS family protein [Paenibacillus sp. H1-7]|uniref:GRAS family protein n=1 Tax=Paenibacillus sp. H1-7 TaxID=2282849 RepID=UPI001EF9B26C|nr:GRAS family protein [Paenibacillus sp. H1-7]